MDDKLFNELFSSVKEMKEIHTKKRKPARITKLEKNEATEIRQKLNLTQAQFATAFGISVSTLRNWEQGHRNPTGPAVILIKVAKKYPEAILKALYT